MINELPNFDAFEQRIEQLVTAIVVTLLGTGVIGFMFLLIDLV